MCYEINFSNEQRAIASKLKGENNLIVDAVPGSGKTTAISHVVQEIPDKSILVILYSRSLTQESRPKIKGENVLIKTIHGAAQKIYQVNCQDDFGLKKILRENLPPVYEKFDILIIDEAQDLTPLLVRFIKKLIQDLQIPQFLFLGDRKQCLYKYKGADERFLTEADSFFGSLSKLPWSRLTLRESYRCTKQMAALTNASIQEDRIFAERSGPLPEYISIDLFNLGPSSVYQKIESLIQEGYTYDDIAILAYTIRGDRSPLQRIARYLTINGVPIYRPNDDSSEGLSSRLLKGKLVISNFHQFKGRERKIVFVIGFDDFLSEMLHKVHDTCTNELYVGLTRAKEKLFIYQHYKNGPLGFVPVEKLDELCKVDGPVSRKKKKQLSEKKDFKLQVTHLTRYVSIALETELESYFDITSEDPLFDIGLKTDIPFGDKFEDVSLIYGLAIPAIKQYRLQGKTAPLNSFEFLRREAKKLDASLGHPKSFSFLSELESFLSKSPLTLVDFARYINLSNCITEYIHPYFQIPDYSWFEKDLPLVEECISRLDFISKDDSFEVPIEYSTEVEGKKFQITGRIDLLGKEGYEFKVVKDLTSSHLYQTLVYASMYALTKGEIIPFTLLNIRTGERKRVVVKEPELILRRFIENRIQIDKNGLSLEDLLNEIERIEA